MRALGALLRIVVIVAATLVAIGAVVYLATEGLTHPDYRSFHAPGSLRGGRAIILAGVLLLIATPIARVAGAVFLFAT